LVGRLLEKGHLEEGEGDGSYEIKNWGQRLLEVAQELSSGALCY
jgi:hypothetical protein